MANRRRRGLATRFTIISAIAVTLLGLVLVVSTSHLMQQQAKSDGIVTAGVVARYVASSVDPQTFVTGVISSTTTDEITSALSGFDETLVALRIWSVDGLLIWDSQTTQSTGFPDGERLDQAIMQGESTAQVVDSVHGQAGVNDSVQERNLDVYAPLEQNNQMVGATQVILDYTATAESLAQAQLTLVLLAGTGLLAIWATLSSMVGSASRRLQLTALENARLALLDPLTGLPNRRMLLERMERAVVEAAENGTGVGLVLLDLDRFKEINDSLGHDYGDKLLIEVAYRLHAGLRDRDVVARLGGDEFAIMLPNIRFVGEAEGLANRVRTLFIQQFAFEDISLHVEASVGVAAYPDHADDVSSLMRKADVAMYSAKTHRTGVTVYSLDDDDSSPARLVLLGDLHRALETGSDISMAYQPKIDLLTGEVAGYEALMRWHHPTRGPLGPTLFIPLAEQSGLIEDVTDFALRTVVRQLSRWNFEGSVLPVAVNLSAHNLTKFGIVETIDRLLSEHQVEPHLLEVEVTETALVADPTRVHPVLDGLAQLGVRVSIDDFGTGNTSISQLRDLAVTALKIDRVFIEDLASRDEKPGSFTVVRAMVDLAHSFGLQVVAEGVEDEHTAALLRRLEVDQAQGFFYSKAVSPREVTKYLRSLIIQDQDADVGTG